MPLNKIINQTTHLGQICFRIICIQLDNVPKNPLKKQLYKKKKKKNVKMTIQWMQSLTSKPEITLYGLICCKNQSNNQLNQNSSLEKPHTDVSLLETVLVVFNRLKLQVVHFDLLYVLNSSQMLTMEVGFNFRNRKQLQKLRSKE